MDKWFNRAGNVALVALLITAGLKLYQGTQVTTPGAEDSVQRGDDLAADGLNITEKTILVVTRSTCGFCTQSMPFYRTLAASRVPIIGLAAEDLETNRRYFAQYEVPVTRVVDLRSTGLRFSSTPTLLVVDAKRKVLGYWRGALDAKGEAEVMAAIQ